MIGEHDFVCVCVMCAYLRVCAHTCGGFPYIGVRLKMPVHKLSNPLSLFIQEAFPLNQGGHLPVSCGNESSPEESDLRPSSRLFLAFRPEDEKYFIS